jgi:hypothetical protein
MRPAAGQGPAQERTVSHTADRSTDRLSSLAATPAAVLPLPVSSLTRFQRLMAYEGWAVDVARMCIDTAYAHDCMATAHTSQHEALRKVALQLFEAYGRNQAAPALH